MLTRNRVSINPGQVDFRERYLDRMTYSLCARRVHARVEVQPGPRALSQNPGELLDVRVARNLRKRNDQRTEPTLNAVASLQHVCAAISAHGAERVEWVQL